jgi:hypothetical protein
LLLLTRRNQGTADRRITQPRSGAQPRAGPAPQDPFHCAANSTTATATPTVTFAYRAVVPHTAAYDTDTVTSPDPVFRRLANQVDISIRYTGPAGTMAVTADVNAPSG